MNYKNTAYPLAIFGIPLSNTDLSNIIVQCLEIIKNNKLTGKSSYLTWVDGTLAASPYGLLPSIVNNPELLSLLRNAHISCISSSFLTKIGNLLGSKTTPPISPHEFLINLIRILGDEEKGIFFLSNHEKEAKSDALALHDKFHKLRLVGIAATPVFTEGEDLIYANERDTLLVEQINASNADVLIMNLGYPKQLLWLDRVSHNLHIPLVITFNENFHLAKQSTSSPLQKQKTNDFSQWLKLTSMSIPLIAFHSLNRYLYQWFFAKNYKKNLNSRLFISEHHTIASIELPDCIDESYTNALNQIFDEVKNHDVLILNFGKVHHIQPEGFYALIKIWLQRTQQNKEIYGYSISNDIEWLMKVHRCWDLFKNTVCTSAEVLMSQLKGSEQISFYDAFTQHGNDVIISILGSLNKDIDFPAYMQKLIHIIDLKNCCIDLDYCTYIDNSGFAFLLDLRKYLHDQKGQLTLLSVNKNLYRQFKAVSLNKTFTFQNSKS